MEDMDVDLTFSDVTNIDISMCEVNRLLNATEVSEDRPAAEESANLDASYTKAVISNNPTHIGDGDSNLNLSDNQLDNVTHEVLEQLSTSDEDTKKPFYDLPSPHKVNVSMNNLINFSMDNGQYGVCNIAPAERQETASLLDATYVRTITSKKQLDPFDVTYVLDASPNKSDQNNLKHQYEAPKEEEEEETGCENAPTGILINFEDTLGHTIQEATDTTLSNSRSGEAETIEEDKGSTMDDLDRSQLVQELNRLKLELNQVKQEDTTLILQLQKTEEILLKAEADFQQKESHYNTQIAEYQEKLANIEKDNNNEGNTLDEEKQLEEGNAKEEKTKEEIAHYKKIVNEYETTLRAKHGEIEMLKQENIQINKHLAVLEAAFSDVISKYDRSKEVIMGMARNETILKEKYEQSNQIALTYEKRYETLKAHANSQLDKANKDTFALKEQHQHEITKLKSIIKHHNIKNASLEQALEQKVAECKALATLWEEMTGGAPQ